MMLPHLRLYKDFNTYFGTIKVYRRLYACTYETSFVDRPDLTEGIDYRIFVNMPRLAIWSFRMRGTRFFGSWITAPRNDESFIISHKTMNDLCRTGVKPNDLFAYPNLD